MPLTTVLPAWAMPANLDSLGKTLPVWFSSTPSPEPKTLLLVRPAWFGELPAVTAAAKAGGDTPICPINFSSAKDDLANDTPAHNTILPGNVTVSGPAEINNCDVVTFTIVAANNTVTTTNVLITSTMPAGFSPVQRVLNVGDVMPSQVITRYAVFSATCDAVSGQNVTTIGQDGYSDYSIYTNFTVNPGAITLRKEPAVIPARVGDVVTWTVYVENTGYGSVSNVIVTDTLGAGLLYTGGITSTSYISIPVDQTYTFTVAAEIISCSGLENDVQASWGCPGQTCQTHGAQASIDLQISEPLLDYTPPDITLDYCTGQATYAMTVTNTGAGNAYTPSIAVDFIPLTVTSSSAGYSGGAFNLPDIPPGGSYPLTFTLAVPDPACGSAGNNGSLLWEPTYFDECGKPFYPPVKSSGWSVAGGTPSLNATKSGPSEVYADEIITYTLNVAATNISDTIYITDTFYPGCAGYMPLNTAGGTVISDTAGNITLTWTTTDTNWSAEISFQPDATSCPALCACCGALGANALQASASDCQDCAVSDNASVNTAIQCEEILNSAKQVSPASDEACTTRTFTNTYNLASTFNVTPTWGSIIFTDTLSNLIYIGNSAWISISNGAQACTATFSVSDTDPLVIGNIAPICGVTVPGATMIIVYQATIDDAFPCTGGSFYDWSYLDIGVTGNGDCPGDPLCDDGVFEEGVWVGVIEPAMELTFTNPPAFVASCGQYTFTMNVTRTSAVPAYDVETVFYTSTYRIVEVIGFGGAVPVLTTTDALGYHWFYGDAFTTATTGTVTLHAQLACASTNAPITGTVYYDGNCSDDDTYDHTCSANGEAAPTPQVLAPYPILYKYPNIIYASGDVVTWTLTAINSGAGPAHSVTLSDSLGSGLRYLTSTITSTMGSAAGVTPITSSNIVTWSSLALLPGEEYSIQFTAEIIGCDDLTNAFSGAQSCQGQICATHPPVTSEVVLPETVLINTNNALTPLRDCLTRTITATVRNAGLLSVYNATITETLPAGMYYVAGSTEYVTGTGATPPATGWINSGEPAGAPAGPLVWNLTQITNLARLYPHETVWVRFDVRASCNFGGGNITIQAAYQDVCGNVRTSTASNFAMPAAPPQMTAQKQARNLTTGSAWGDTVYAEPGQTIRWAITLTNGSATPAQYTVVTDVLPANTTYAVASPLPDYIDIPGGIITWNLGTLTQTTWSALITATVDNGGCTADDTTNVFTATWGCDDGCREQATAQAALRTRPVFDEPDLTTDLPPATLHRCGGLLTVTLVNNGPPAYGAVLTDTLPTGFVYSETVYASTAPLTYPAAGDNPAVWAWGAITLPTGITTLTFRVNSGSNGTCADPAGGNNIVTVLFDDASSCLATGPYTTTGSAAIAIISPTLVIEKTPAAQTAAVGEVVTWTITVTNTGSGDAPDVVVTDTIGPGFSDSRVITWSIGTLAAISGTWTATVTATVAASGAQTNSVQASGACAAGCIYATAADTAYVTLLQDFGKSPEVQTGTIGSLVAFTFTASLPDQSALYENLTLTDTLPAGLGYVASSLFYTYNIPAAPTALISTTPTITPGWLASGDVIWALGALSGAVSVNGIITAVIQDVAANQNSISLTNVLTMTYTDDGQTYAYTDTARVDILEPVLHIGKSYITPHGCSATLLQDNFNDDNDSGWSGDPGWVVADGAYVAGPGGLGTGRFTGDASWIDYSLSAMVRIGADGSGGLYFRRQDTTHYYLFMWRENPAQLDLLLANGGAPFGIAAAVPWPWQPDRWYHIEVRVEGGRLRAFVDGQLAYDVFNATLASGGVGVGGSDSTSYFDNILVTRLGDMACTVGANDLVTYTLTISNQWQLAGYDLLITDTLPAGMSLVTYTLESDDPITIVEAEPAPIPGATGVLTWGINQLEAITPFTTTDHTALTVTVVLQVSDAITANVTLPNQAVLSYDNWEEDGDPAGDPYGINIERGSSGGSHSAAVRTVDGGIAKTVRFSPPPTATLGTLVTYTLIVPAQPITATLYNLVITDALDSRLLIQDVSTVGGTGASSGWAGQVVTAAFASIPHDTQAYITVTARISHEHPSAANDANAGEVITNTAVMTHAAAAEITTTNEVSTTVGEPNLLLEKSVESSTGGLTDLDGTAALTYTIRLTNTGSSPAHSIYISDVVPAGISVTAQYGGDSRSGPLVGTGVMTWYVGTLGNTAGTNVVVLTYTARISRALSHDWLTNTVGLLYHSLTDTVPGVRPYTGTDSATVETAGPQVSKSTGPYTLHVGDIVTYTLVFTVPAGTVGMGGSSYLVDTLPPGVQYITASESLAWTPTFVSVTTTGRAVDFGNPGQIITWTFGSPITSTQDTPTVITLTFQAQATGRRVDTGAAVWPDQEAAYPLTNTVALWQRGELVDDDAVDNEAIQPSLNLDKDSTPPSGAYVGAGDTITYTLIITNDGLAPAYDLVITDWMPAGIDYVRTISAPNPVSAVITTVMAGSGITYTVSQLAAGPGATMFITVVARVTDTVGANLILTNTAAIPYYDSQSGPGPSTGLTPTQRTYTDGSDAVNHRTVDGGIAKSVINPISTTLGHVITYHVIVPAQPITATLYTATVADTLDPRLQLQSVTNGPDGAIQISGNTYTVTYPGITAGGQRTITITAVLSHPLGAVAGDTITNVATLTHTNGGPTPSNIVTTTVHEPRLTLTKDADPPGGSVVDEGYWITYTLIITNAAGPEVSPAYDLVVWDTLPNWMRTTTPTVLGITINSSTVTTDSQSYDGVSGLLVITLTPGISLPVGGSLAITYLTRVDVGVPSGLTLTNQAQGGYSSLPGDVPGDRDYTTNEDEETHYTPIATGLHKFVTPPTVTIGSQVVYTYRIPSPLVGATLNNVVFTDTIPSNFTVTGVSGDGGFSSGWSGGNLITGTVTAIPAYSLVVVTVTCAVRDIVTNINGLAITNTAFMDYSGNTSDTVESNVVTTTLAEPNVGLSKTVELPRNPAGAGDVVTYTLTLTNTGTWPAFDLIITDTLPGGITFLSTQLFGVSDPVTATLTDTNAAGASLLTWAASRLNVDGVVTIRYTARVSSAIGAGLTLTNTAWGSYDNQPGNDPGERDYAIPPDETPMPTGHPALALTKSAVPSPVGPNSLLTYTLVVTNTGIVNANGVLVTDTVPANTVFVVGTTPRTGPDAGGVMTWTLGTLVPNASAAVTFTVRVDAGVASGTVLTNTAWLTSSEGLTDTDTITTPVQLTDIAITKSVTPPAVVSGVRVTFTLAYSNTGPVPAENVVVTDTLPSGLSYLSAAPPPTAITGRTITWSLGTLNPGTGGVIQLVASVDATSTTYAVFTNTVVITTATPETDTSNNDDDASTVLTQTCDLSIVKTAQPASVVSGDSITYTLTYANAGPADAAGVTLTDTLPSGLTFAGCDPAICGAAGQTITWSLSTVPASASGVLTLYASVNVTGALSALFTNTTVITTTTRDRDPDNNTDETTTPLTQTIGLQVLKWARPEIVAHGQTLTYTVWLVNTGDVPLNPVALTDTLPAGLLYANNAAPAEPDLITGQTQAWNDVTGGAGLAAGDMQTVTFRATVSVGVGITGTYINHITGSGGYPGGTVTDTDSTPVTVTTPAVDVDKTLAEHNREAGIVTFTIAIINTGPSTLTLIPLHDVYDSYYLGFRSANPVPDAPADDGRLDWLDLTAPAPNGFGADLPPGERFTVTMVFGILHDITTTINTAVITDATDIYNNPTNDADDDEALTDVPTAVELLYFRATPQFGLVLIEWATAVEIDNYGFYLLRSTGGSLDDAKEFAFIPAAGHGRGSGAAYSYKDLTVQPGVAYTYWLVDIDTAGRHTVHPPTATGSLPWYLYLPLIFKAGGYP